MNFVDSVGAKKPKTHNERKRQTLIFIIVMMAIPIVHHFVFFLYPNINSFFLAFRNENKAGQEIWYGFKNFQAIFDLFTKGDKLLLNSFKNTMSWFLFSSVLMFSLSYVWSYFFYKRIAGRSFFRVIFYITSIIGVSTTAAIFKFMLEDQGFLSEIYCKIAGVDYAPAFFLEEEYAQKLLYIFVFWNGFGGSYILFGGAYSKIPDDLVEYSLIDGISNMWQEIWYIILPLTWSTVSTLFLINLGSIFSASGPILILTKNVESTHTLSYFMFKRIAFDYSYYQPAALGMLMTLVTLPLFFFSRWAMRKVESVEY